MFRTVSFDPGPVKDHLILATKTLKIGSDPTPYEAVLVDTDQGRKIVLIRYEPSASGWWSRVFDA